MSKKSWLEEYYPVPADQVAEKDAVAHTRRKWEGLLPENLKKHGLSDPPIDVDTTTCALCVHYYHHPMLGQEYRSCTRCPLANARGGVPCDRCRTEEHEAPYHAWSGYEDPTPMIQLLREIGSPKPPTRIFLQHDPEATGEPFSEAAEVTWSKDRIYDTDQEYIRADLVKRGTK